MGRAPRTKETLPDFLKWRRVTRHPLIFRGLTGSQQTTGFGASQCHRPPTLHTRRPRRWATSGRSRRPNFTTNHRRTRPDRAGEVAAVATVGHRTFLDFPAISGHFQSTHTSLPPFWDPLNSFPWSIFADSSPFESYDENKVGRRLDQVFRPPQQLLDQGNGTDEFLVSWAFH